jgi:hypothetical protein
MTPRPAAKARRRLVGCGLSILGTIGLALLWTGVLAEVHPGSQRPDVIRAFGIACLVLGAGLTAPWAREALRRDRPPD